MEVFILEFSVSIIIPVMNSGKTIEKALQSVIKQKTEDVELIVIDGGSSDDTMSIVEKYKGEIDFYYSGKDYGYADALNKGIAHSTCKYYMMLAADDVLIDYSIELVKNSIKEETDVWCGAVIECDELGYRYTTSNSNFEELYKYCSLKHPATVFKKNKVIGVGGYDIDYKCAADRELFLRLYEKNAVFQTEDIPITLFSMSGMSNKMFQVAMDEDYKLSVQYGVSEAMALQNKKNVELCKAQYHRMWGFKLFLKKIGLLPYAYKLMGRDKECLTKKEIKYYLRKDGI